MVFCWLNLDLEIDINKYIALPLGVKNLINHRKQKVSFHWIVGEVVFQVLKYFCLLIYVDTWSMDVIFNHD